MAYKREAKQHQRDLMINSTESEKKLICVLDFIGIDYRFQKIIKTDDGWYYIVDFYFPKTKTVLEVDGEYHNSPEQKRKDVLRQNKLEEMGYRVFRISDDDVEKIHNIVLSMVETNKTKLFREIWPKKDMADINIKVNYDNENEFEKQRTKLFREINEKKKEVLENEEQYLLSDEIEGNFVGIIKPRD